MVNEGCIPESEFLVKAGEYIKAANEKHISVRLTVKRLVKKDEVDGNPEFDPTRNPVFDVSKVSSLNSKVKNNSDSKYPLLIRLSYGSHGKKTKCSSVIDSTNLDKFWQDYSNIAKSGMNGLVKKKKKKAKNANSKDKKKKSQRAQK
ncbi:RNA-binding signal recognition particle subunit [Maudiozyma humilis]|uniref:Signal recognition particle subunit SRP14 n=1 Tax=Maudiozyma humilis TaxID=51915 RepID=A0AAV5RRA0_MAUHU|nr:RNA-binding signal recognition particle subunit [Kazachstania humilis]